MKKSDVKFRKAMPPPTWVQPDTKKQVAVDHCRLAWHGNLLCEQRVKLRK